MLDVLWYNEWVSLYQITAPDVGVDGYTYSHETRCAGRIVVVLPFRVVEDSSHEHSEHNTDVCGQGDDAEPNVHMEILLRDEITPCWHLTESQLSSITGGWEVDDDVECCSTAKRELWEEAGYNVELNDLTPLGECRGTKSTDTQYFIYAVDLTDVEQTGDGSGDGSELETMASCRWVVHDAIFDVVDPLVHIARNRLMAYLIAKFVCDDKSWYNNRTR